MAPVRPRTNHAPADPLALEFAGLPALVGHQDLVEPAMEIYRAVSGYAARFQYDSANRQLMVRTVEALFNTNEAGIPLVEAGFAVINENIPPPLRRLQFFRVVERIQQQALEAAIRAEIARNHPIMTQRESMTVIRAIVELATHRGTSMGNTWVESGVREEQPYPRELSPELITPPRTPIGINGRRLMPLGS